MLSKPYIDLILEYLTPSERELIAATYSITLRDTAFVAYTDNWEKRLSLYALNRITHLTIPTLTYLPLNNLRSLTLEDVTDFTCLNQLHITELCITDCTTSLAKLTNPHIHTLNLTAVTEQILCIGTAHQITDLTVTDYHISDLTPYISLQRLCLINSHADVMAPPTLTDLSGRNSV